MKTGYPLGVALFVFASCLLLHSSAQERLQVISYEYATIRWAGKENTQIIRAGGKVEFIGPELRKLTRPDRADERSFYMNAALNGLAKEGYEFAGMTQDEVVMKRRTGL